MSESVAERVLGLKDHRYVRAWGGEPRVGVWTVRPYRHGGGWVLSPPAAGPTQGRLAAWWPRPSQWAQAMFCRRWFAEWISLHSGGRTVEVTRSWRAGFRLSVQVVAR